MYSLLPANAFNAPPGPAGPVARRRIHPLAGPPLRLGIAFRTLHLASSALVRRAGPLDRSPGCPARWHSVAAAALPPCRPWRSAPAPSPARA